MKKFGICVESSHQKGMGHLARALNFIELLKEKKEDYILIINDDTPSISFLKKLGIDFEVIDLNNPSDWETLIIRRYGINVWVNDRLNTSIEHARNVKLNHILLVCIDDEGAGAELADINFGTLPSSFNRNLKGKKVLKGIEYLILDKRIDRHKRIRKRIESMLVVLGGSDTYGVTVKVVRILKEAGRSATIVAGPLFRHHKELDKVIDKSFIVKTAVPSLIREFADYDLAITGGGITPFEANASGLPCIVITNELFEIPNSRFLSELGSSVYAGYREAINRDIFTRDFDIAKMSWLGMDRIKTNGADRIHEAINQVHETATTGISSAYG